MGEWVCEKLFKPRFRCGVVEEEPGVPKQRCGWSQSSSAIVTAHTVGQCAPKPRIAI